MIDSDDNILSTQEYSCVSKPDSDIFNPIYQFEILLNNEELITNPYLYLHFLVVVIDDIPDFGNLGDNVYNNSILGVGLFNLFLDEKTKEAPGDETEVKKLLIFFRKF